MEFLLFAGIGSLAIIAAVAMLISDNAVYSALFLIVNFLCVAFLYLMLEAPFLAMVQIAVYAGAIMVLFLFVIMLLGAEKTASSTRRSFKWLPGLAMGLTLAFLFSVGAAIASGNIEGQPQPPQNGGVRFVHAAPPRIDVPEGASEAQLAIAERRFDVLVDGDVLVEDLTFNDLREDIQHYVELAPGEHTITVSPANTDIPFKTLPLTVEDTTTYTVVLYGDTDANLTAIALEDNLGVPTGENANIAVFNALAGPAAVSLGDLESELFDDSRKLAIVAEDVAYGTVSSSLSLNTSASTNWVIFEGGTQEAILDGNFGSILMRLNNVEDVDAERKTSYLYVLTGERTIDGSLRPTLITRTDPTSVPFGNPQAVGMRLFTEYVLPIQLVALLLLAAMIGVIVLTLREEHTQKPSRLMRRKVSRPLTSVIAAQTGSDLGASAPQIAAPKQPEQPEPAGD